MCENCIIGFWWTRVELLHNLAYMWGENQKVSVKSVDHESKLLLLLLHPYTSDH